jgi:fused signal recognition particle receptor
MEIVIALIVIGLLAGIGLGLVIVQRRSAAPELEPPSTRPVGRGTDTLVEEPPVDEAVVVEEPPVEAPGDEVVVVEEPPVEDVVVEEPLVVEEPAVKPRFRDRLAKARGTLAGYVGSVLSRPKIDAESWDELEEALIRADVGVGTATDVLATVRAEVDEQGITDTTAVIEVLKAELKVSLAADDRGLRLDEGRTNIWLFVGVNGVGKTTTIGKLGKREVDAGHSVVFAAGDTFRAAAAEQLGLWAERAGATLVRGDEGADPSSIIYDAVESGAAKGADLVLADTAGRLHTKVNLMEELRKVRRVAEKGDGVVTEVLLVVDATTGQNGLVQAQQFTEAVEVTGVVLTKLDGSAKGGIVLAIQSELGIPVKLVGLGEGVEDLVEFDPDEFVEALFC